MDYKGSRAVVLSGIRATGRMHLGNYIGALQHFVKLAQDPNNDCFYFIADLHTLTTKTDPTQIGRNRLEIVLDFLGAGLDPERATLYVQSSVPEITELSWLLACLTSFSELERMPHWAEKKQQLEKQGRSANAGLFTYPVLMAADILGPRANIVPVGQDQHPHVELARSLVRVFNRDYGELFPLPRLLDQEGVRVPALGTSGKMGKSEAESGTVFLSDPSGYAWQKVKVALTDPSRKRRNDPGDPSKCNIFMLHTILSTPEEIQWASEGCRSAGIGCIECKQTVFRHIQAILEPFQERRREFEAKGLSFVEELLREGGKRARARIAETVAIAKERMGVSGY